MLKKTIVASRGRNPDNPVQMLEELGGCKVGTLSTVEKDNMVLMYEED